jgi:cytochrome P450
MSAETLPAVNPHEDSFYQDPFPTYSMLRAEAPVYEIPDTPGLFFVTTWPLVREALMDPGRFSNIMPHARRTSPPPEAESQVQALRAQGYPYSPALGTNDPPQHTRYRKMVNRAFTVRSLAWMEPLVDEVADLISRGLDEGVTARRAIGYAQALGQIRSELTQEQAIAETQALTRRYARRQVSWFKRYDSSTVIDVSAPESHTQVSDFVQRVVADLAP